MISDDFVRALAITGSQAERCHRLRALRNTGIDDLIFPLMGSGRLERLDRLASDIAPAMEG